MRSTYKTMLVALVVVSAISAMAASAALAERQWETKNAGVWKPVASAAEVKGTGELRLENREWGGMEQCHVETSGTVEPHGKGTITAFALSSCKKVNAGCQEWYVRRGALHLPWKTELFIPAEGSSSTRNRIVEDGSNGLPQEEFGCVRAGIWEEVKCGLNTTQQVGGEVPNAVRLTFLRSETEQYYRCTLEPPYVNTWWEGKLVIKPPTGTEGIRAA